MRGLSEFVRPQDSLHTHTHTHTHKHARTQFHTPFFVLLLLMVMFSRHDQRSGDGVWSWDEFQQACDLLLDTRGNPSGYRRSILMADDIVLQRAVQDREEQVQELTDRIEAMHKEYEDLVCTQSVSMCECEHVSVSM